MGTDAFSSAEAVSPVPPLADTTVVGPLEYTVATVTLIFTVSAHEEPAAIATPDRLTTPLPATADGVPPQVLAMPLDKIRPAGNASVNATPVSATVLAAGFVMA